jgi:hypothetical protein
MIKLFINNKIIQIKIGMILFVFNTSFCFSQGFNHTWLLGYDIGLFDTNVVTSTKARLNFDANNVTVIPETRPMPFYETQGNISDVNGNLLIASNGCWIANSTGNMMMNGCCLNPGLFTNDWCDNTTGLILPHGNVILPFPGDSDKFVLFHQTGNYNANQASTVLYYSVIDMTLDSGLGGVIQKNDTVLQDTLSWGIGVCQHANGRDWWIVVLRDYSNLIFKVLLTPNGISSVTTQILNVPFAYSNVCQPTFSPDGTKFSYTYGHSGITPFHDVRLFHFDRCNGMFSDTTYIPFSDGTTGFGLAFSPDSKYLYHCSFQKIYQINTDTNNIVGTVDTVAYNDGYYSPYPPFQSNFWLMYLAANGKIYVSSGSGVIDMHYINYPDLPDTTCDVHQHALHLPFFYVGGNVNHPNYYLGPVIGSVCDSLGLSVQEINHDFHFSMYPNPVTEQRLKIIYLLPQNKEGTFEIFDIGGRKVYSLRLPQWSTLQMINLPELSEGLYQCVITSGHNRVSKKIAVIND